MINPINAMIESTLDSLLKSPQGFRKQKSTLNKSEKSLRKKRNKQAAKSRRKNR